MNMHIFMHMHLVMHMHIFLHMHIFMHMHIFNAMMFVYTNKSGSYCHLLINKKGDVS